MRTNELDGLLCSLVDSQAKWGRHFARWVPNGFRNPLGANQLPPGRVFEFPWPILASRLAKRVLPRYDADHLRTNRWFDTNTAKWLKTRSARVFVGGETSALESLKQAQKLGMKCVLDSPGIPSAFLDTEAQKAADKFSVKLPLSSNTPEMRDRKQAEFEEADVVLCCSNFQRDQLLKLNPTIRRTEVIPLWADVEYWQTAHSSRRFSDSGSPLRVLYAGAVNFRKGIPYLLEAIEPLGREVSLTLVGNVSVEMKGVLRRYRQHRHIGYVNKDSLNSIYARHDVLVMPSLGDSFGFVTMEAMASGIPVISSQNAGAPIPDTQLRVPPHDSDAIRSRLLTYHNDRELLRYDADEAARFAAMFDPKRYRRQVGELFSDLIHA